MKKLLILAKQTKLKQMKTFFLISFVTTILGYFGYTFVDLKPNTKTSFEYHGIDISHHNKIYNWKKIKNNASFCFMKATQGSSFKDPRFNQNWTNAKNHGLVRGAYCFFQPGVSAEKQFNNFKNTVKLSKGDLPPVLDVELKECNMKEVNKWLKLAEKHYGVKPIIYSTYLFFKVFMDGRIDSGYPLWLHMSPKYKTLPSFDDYDCVFWQYDQKGKMGGINGEVDLNYYLGDRESFDDLLIK